MLNSFFTYILGIILCLVTEYLMFGLIAYFKGKKFKHDCNNCDNWACTHNGPYQNKPCYPVRDWHKWCYIGKKE